MRFKDKVVLITGSGSGQGRAEALLFAAEGAHVVVDDINKEGADETVAMVRKKKFPGEVRVSYADVRVEQAVRQMVQDAVKTFKRIDVLVNNAGIYRGHSVPETPVEEFYEVIDTNVKGPFLCCKYVVPHMLKAKSGVIVNVASIGSFIALEGSAVYAASKAAVTGFTRGLALDLAPSGIRVNAIGPGWTKTPMIQSLMEDPNISKALLADTPAGRFAEPEDQAHLVLFLASDDAAYIYGQTICCDGGWTLR
jgi:NAD(P)-dependent dehydrogenase (short-subunit alcohol dehydrogenase family)